MKNTFKNAKVGQKVWSTIFGSGRIRKINIASFAVYYIRRNGQPDTVLVEEYTFDGVVKNSVFLRDLYFKKPLITTKKRIENLRSESFEDGVELGQTIPELFRPTRIEIKKGGFDVIQTDAVRPDLDSSGNWPVIKKTEQKN